MKAVWYERTGPAADVLKTGYGEDAFVMTSLHSGCFLYWAST